MSKTRSFVEICKAASEGTTNRVRLQEDRFLRMTIPLPPLPEQRRIVARIEEMAAKINEARTLRRQGDESSNGIISTHAGQVFGYWAKRYPPRKFSSFSPHVTSGPRNWAKHYETSGYRFYRAQDIDASGNVSEDSKVFITPPPGEQGRSAMLQTGDVMLVITGATVGRVSTFREGLEPGFVSQHVAICRLPSEAVEPRFVLWGLRTPYGQEQLLGQRYGQGKPGLNLSNIRNLSLPFPPLFAQRRIVAELDALQAKVDGLKKLQA
jgi:type I restriction enzyme S subunit